MHSNYKVYSLNNFREIPQIKSLLSEAEKHSIEVVGNVLPFKVNNYVVDELIDWSNIPDDPIFQLTFPQKDMLNEVHFNKMEAAISGKIAKREIKTIANQIRYELNPNPDGQELNVPYYDGIKLTGIQHKYRETVLFFPSNSQTCHAYCTFCFRWPQFVGIDELKFGMRETELLVKYLQENREVTDLLFTGGDPMIMKSKIFKNYIHPLFESHIPNLHSIRIGTKALSYWPYRFLTDSDADDLLRLFESIVENGYHLAFMAHFNHPRELQTKAVKQAIKRIQNTGAQIRTQSPIMKHINDQPGDWVDMWKMQVKFGCIPYYMFVARDTGAQEYFSIPLVRAWKIYKKAIQQVSGLSRTVRGPSMSANPGKVHILGVNEIKDEQVMTMQFLQARNPSWVGKPFFAKYDPDAIWLDELTPAFGKEEFFFNDQLDKISLN